MNKHIILDENGVENMEGHKGSRPIAEGIPFYIGDEMSKYLPFKEEWLPKIAAKLSEMKAAGDHDFIILSNMLEGPGTGIDYNDKTGEIRIADGWTVKDGFIVKG